MEDYVTPYIENIPEEPERQFGFSADKSESRSAAWCGKFGLLETNGSIWDAETVDD
jgi:hypothetical protein